MENERKIVSLGASIERASLTPAEIYKQESKGLFGLERGTMPHDIASSFLVTALVTLPILAGSFALVYSTDNEPKTSPNHDLVPTPVAEILTTKVS